MLFSCHFRRKKRCIRFLDNSCSDEVASGGDAPTVVADSTSDAQISTSDAHHSFPPQRHRTHGPSSSGDVTLSKTQWPSPSSCSTLVSPVTGPGYRCLSPSLVARWYFTTHSISRHCWLIFVIVLLVGAFVIKLSAVRWFPRCGLEPKNKYLRWVRHCNVIRSSR